MTATIRVTAMWDLPAKRSVFAAALVALLLPALATADGPTQNDFYREMLTPGPTALTSEFHAYYEGAYTVDKLRLLESFPSFARKAGQPVRALVVIGPLAPVWTYHVMTLVSVGKAIRCNALVMPHARITGKATGRLSEATVQRFLRDLVESPLLKDRGHTRSAISAQLPVNDLGDFQFDILVADFKSSPPVVRVGDLDQASDRDAVERVLDVVNRHMDWLKSTYVIGE